MTELAAIAALARTRFTEQESKVACALLRTQLDWELFAELAEHNAVVPLVWSGLQETGAVKHLPPQTKARLEELNRAIAWNNMLLAGEMRSVVQALANRGLDPIPVRGAALAAWLYGDVSRRMFADIDILVRQERLPEAADCLRAMGLVPIVPHSGLDLERLIRSDCEWHFTAATGTEVELHWRLFQPRLQFRRFERELWRRSETGSFLGRPIRTLSPVDTVLMLAVHHGGKHRFDELRHVCDFSELVRSELVEWHAVAERARETGMLRYVHTALLVVQRVFGNSLPEAFQGTIQNDPVAVDLADALASPFLNGSEAIHDVPQVLYFMGLRERIRDRLRYLPWLTSWFSSSVFVPTDKELRYLPLPRPLRPLLVPFRLARLAVKHSSRLMRRKICGARDSAGLDSEIRKPDNAHTGGGEREQ